jgi:capping protein (actin filament) muscle Z-line, beta
MFATYVKLYYDASTVSSVYFVDTQDAGFNACFLVKKEISDEKDIKTGCWDAVHVVTCNLKKAPTVQYRVISTVMITIDAATPTVGSFTISGSCSKTTDETVNLPSAGKIDLDHFHIRTIGKIIENNEGLLRNDVVENYINKQRQITNTARLMEEYMTREQKQKF